MGSATSRFYLGVACYRTVLAVAYTLGFGRDAAKVDLGNPVALCPSWLPYGALLAKLHHPSVYRALYHGLPVTLITAACFPSYWPVRMLAAGHAAVQHLSQATLTRGHDEYASCYTLLALGSPWAPEALGPGVALGSAIYMMFASGVSKLAVGGPADWCKPDTLGHMLRKIGSIPLPGGALAPGLMRWMLTKPALLAGGAASTLVFELGSPAAFALPSGAPMLLACLALHAGHVALMSLYIGLPFALCGLPVYALGFLGSWPRDSAAWWIGLGFFGIYAGAALLVRRDKMLPEDWPCTCYPLFAHSGRQHSLLALPLDSSEGRTRLVVCTDRAPDPPIGCLLSKESTPRQGENAQGPLVHAGKGGEVHDAWGNCFGWTASVWPRLYREAKDPVHLAQLLQDRLQAERRCMERSSGLPLTRAYVIRLEEKEDRVAELISEWDAA